MKDMQKHKSRTETAGAYATANSTSRSSQVLNTGNLHKNKQFSVFDGRHTTI